MRKESCFFGNERPPVYDLNPMTDAGFKLMIRKAVGSFSSFIKLTGEPLVYG